MLRALPEPLSLRPRLAPAATPHDTVGRGAWNHARVHHGFRPDWKATRERGASVPGCPAPKHSAHTRSAAPLRTLRCSGIPARRVLLLLERSAPDFCARARGVRQARGGGSEHSALYMNDDRFSSASETVSESGGVDVEREGKWWRPTSAHRIGQRVGGAIVCARRSQPRHPPPWQMPCPAERDPGN